VKYGVQRILVVDWDAHHGNGMERIFYRDPGVLYFSLHRDFAYPATGWVERTGEGAGRGYNVNVPLPIRSGDADYRTAWETVLVPLADAFRPELVVVCAGYDAHAGDHIGGMNVTDAGFAWLHRSVMEIAGLHAGGRIIVTLEGGYNPDVLARNVLGLLNVWTGRETEKATIAGKPKAATRKVLERVRQVHGDKWKL